MTLADSIAAEVRRGITSGALQPGDFLPPIKSNKARRDAYRTLLEEKLIEHAPPKGMRVIDARPSESTDFDSRVEAAADRLRHDITSRVLPPGTILVGPVQAQRIGASIRVTRRACQILINEKLITYTPGVGVHVAGRQPSAHAVVVDWVLSQVSSGALPAGAALPALPEIAKTMGVSGYAVSQAFARLRRDGVVHAISGTGMFVSGAAAQKPPSTVDTVAAYLENLIATTLAPGDKLPSYQQISAMFPARYSTVARVFARLKALNYAVSRHGGGVFVADTPEVTALRQRTEKPQ